VGWDAPAPHQPARARAAPQIPELMTIDPVKLVPEPSRQKRMAAVQAARNPLLEASQVLLRALADMPAHLSAQGVDAFYRLLVQEVTIFQALCAGAQIKHEHSVAASYALCTAIDEAANSTEWGGVAAGNVDAVAGVWSNQQLARHFHDDIEGGHKVFLLIGRLAAAPQEHIDLLELMVYILGLGFEGSYSARSGANASRQLQTIRHRLYTMVAAARDDVPVALSAHWQGTGAGKFKLLRSVPVWVTVAVSAVALLGIFAWYKYQLGLIGADVQTRIHAIGAMQPPAARAHKSLRLKELLSAEIARGTVSVEEDSHHSAVSFKGDDMFVLGQARLNAKILPVIAKVANEVNEVSGTVRVTGHSDNQPIKTREFPDNQSLSEKRAKAVAEVLKGKGVASERLQVEGRGDAAPIADNATAAGRAKNRRVDIVVMQGSTKADVTSTGASAAAATASPGPAKPLPAR